ncbi:MAG TPA: MFS transporter, partial [Arachidicoccus soli]|nr:MFS transporter [Arachidicoccus soli]
MNSLQTTKREYLLYVLSAATFVIFYQLYMVAPLLPSLSVFFNVSEQTIGLIIPAYLIPYGISTLFYGLLADKIGTKRIVLSSLFVFALLTSLTSFSQSVSQLIVWRLLTGIGASGVVPMALAWTGQSYSYEERGRPLGWLFGAMAGGMAFGASTGVILESYIGWRMLFLGASILAVLIWIILWFVFRNLGDVHTERQKLTLAKVFNGYKILF